MARKITVYEVAYHRNGVGGAPFHAVRFADQQHEKGTVMVGIVFEEPGHVAVLSVNKLAGLGQEATVAFGVNSYRGDVYAPALRRAIKEAQS